MNCLSDQDFARLNRIAGFSGLSDTDWSDVKRFVEAGLLKPGSAADRLCASRTIAALKAELRARQLPVGRGTKAELAARLASGMSPQELGQLTQSVHVFVLTEISQAGVDAYKERRRDAHKRLEAQAFDFLLAGRVDEAAKLVAARNAEDGLALGEGGADFLLPTSASTRRIRVLLKFDYSDVNLAEAVVRQIGPTLALSEMLGDSPSESLRRLLSLTSGEFSCPTLEKWLREEPCGDWALQFASEVEDGPDWRALAELYAHTKLSEAANLAVLEEAMEAPIGEGIEIERCPGDHQCRVCSVRRRLYRWGELAELPKLPRHWGCRCTYQIRI